MARPETDSRYRTPREFTSLMREATNAYLELNQFTGAFEFLTNVVTSGNSTGTGNYSEQPAFVPTVEQLGLAATLVVHPSFTTRAGSSEDARASDDALRFLRHVGKTLGPINARFSEAFSFHASQSPRGERRYSRLNLLPDSGADDHVDKLDSEYAQNKSLSAQAESFWHVVGWTFNCAIKWPDRYERWQLLLKFWIELADRDLEDRQALAREHGERTLLEQSMVWSSFKTSDGSVKQGILKICRAIMADADDRALNEFREVWKNETKKRKKPTQQGSKRESINLDQNRWGDYQAQLDEDILMEDEPKRPNLNEEDRARRYTNSIALRCRLISLMLKVTSIPDNPLAPIGDFLETIAEFIRPLDVDSFQKYLTYIRTPPGVGAAFPSSIILPFLASRPRRINLLDIDQDFAAAHFVTQRANSADPNDQAKLSLLIEELIALMIDHDLMHDPNDFKRQVQQGIERRKDFAAVARKRSKRKGSDEAVQILNDSSNRMLLLLDLYTSGRTAFSK